MAGTYTHHTQHGLEQRRPIRARPTREEVRQLLDTLPDDDMVEAARRLDALRARRDPHDEELIRRWFRPHPHKRGLAEAVLAESGVPAWAIVGHFRADGSLVQLGASSAAVLARRFLGARASRPPRHLPLDFRHGVLAATADAYDVPREAVEAALAYCRRYPELIDARIYTGEPTALEAFGARDAAVAADAEGPTGTVGADHATRAR